MKIESEKFKRREEKLLLMHKVGAELLSTANIEKVLTKITETAIDITEAEEAALFLKSENGDKLFLRALKKVDKENAEALNIDVTDFMEYPPKDRLQSIKLSNREIEKATGKFPKYLINVPIKSTMGEVGLLCVYNFKLEKQFDEEDEELLTILANYTSSAVKNKKLVDDAFQEAEMLSGLFNVSQSMLSEVDLHKLLGIIADNALEVLGADIVVLYEYSKEKDDVEIPPIFRGKNIKEPKRLSERGKTHRESVVFKLLKSGTSFYASNAREDWKSLFLSDEKEDDLEDHFISREKIISSAGIPLYINGEPVGVLFINYRTYCAFTPQLRTTIKQFANEAALAIRNAKIFSQRDRYINELSVLNKIVQEISSTVTLNIDEILKLIFAQTGRLMDVRNFFAALYDKEKDTVSFEFAVENGILQEMGVGQWTPRKAGNGLTEYVIHTQEALLIQKDIYDWLELHGVCPLGNPSKSWLGAPMMLKNEVLGVIVIQNTWEENAYDEGHKKILETIASQAAIAIDKARLFQDYQKQVDELNSLYNISQEIVTESMDIESVLKTILEKAVQIANVDAGEILFYDVSTGINKIVVTHNLDALKGIIIGPGYGMAGMVVKTQNALFTNDYFNSPYKLSKLDTPTFRKLIKGVLQVPLKWHEKLLGLLALSYKPHSDRVFTDKDVELLEHFAGPASIAIGIARNISFQKTLLNDSPDAIVAVDRRGIITEFNSASEKIMGIKKDDVIGKSVTDLYFDGEEEARRINRLLIEREKRGEPLKEIPTATRGPNGERIPILFSGGFLRNEFKERIGSIGIMRDLRKIEMMDHEYRVQQHFLTSIEQYPQDSPVNTQADLKLRLTEILKKTREFCQVKYIILFASTVENDTVLKAIAWDGVPLEIEKKLPHFNWRKAGLLAEGNDKKSILKNEIEFLNKWLPDNKWKRVVVNGIRGNNSEFFKNLSCGVPVRLADNYRGVLVFGPFKADKLQFDYENAAFIRDIAQSININALSWLQALYLRSKNKESERSIQLIVHRSRMQLQQILARFGIIKSNVKENSHLQEHAEEGERLVSHLSKVISKGLTSCIGEMEPEDFNFQDYPLPVLIQNCVENFQEKARNDKRELLLDSESIENLPNAEIDHLMLSVALGNLIDNALKYSFEGTYIKIFSEYDTKQATIIVQDLGEQMSENAKNNLIRPGKRWGMSPRARNIPGTGFGLWDASVIAAAHGGKVDFSSVLMRYLKGKQSHLVRIELTVPFKHEKL